MYTFSSKLKLSFIINGLRSIRIDMVLTAPKDIQEVEIMLVSESHGGHGEVQNEV
jgi:hypothetical protein